MKKFSITLIEDNDKVSLFRENDGFNSAFELLGILEHAQLEILQQLSGEIKPDVIKRNFIED